MHTHTTHTQMHTHTHTNTHTHTHTHTDPQTCEAVESQLLTNPGTPIQVGTQMI